jgi:hypothetical protein
MQPQPVNLNRRIEKLEGHNRFVRKINEIIDTVNWLCGMRTTNGNIISETARGPVLDSRPPVP